MARITGTGTLTPTGRTGTLTFTGANSTEYNNAVAAIQGNPGYTITAQNASQRRINFTFNIAEKAKLTSVLTMAVGAAIGGNTITGVNLATSTVTYSIDSNRGPV